MPVNDTSTKKYLTKGSARFSKSGNFPAWIQYGSSLAIIAIVFFIHSLVHPHAGNEFLGITLIISTLLSASIGGFWPSVIVGVGGLVILSSIFQSQETEPADWVGFTFYFVIIFGMAFLGARLTSARRLAEVSAQKLEATLRSIGEGVLVTDREGRVVSLNPVAESLTGWSSDEALGQSADKVFRIVDELSLTPIQGLAKQVIGDKEEIRTRQHILLEKNESRQTTIEDSASPVRNGNGAILGCVIVFRDITARRATELTLREQDTRKNTFIATLAHELRNPLAPIVAGIEVLKAPNITDLQRTQLISILERQSNQLAVLVDDLLDVSRVTTNKLQLRKAQVELRQILDQAVEASLPNIQACEHELSINIPEQAIALEADKNRLVQAFSNLLNNASKFTPTGGKIGLSVKLLDTLVSVAVTDNGVGIAPEKFGTIFDMFSQIEHPISRDASGLGIGLGLTKHLVELHGGDIQVFSPGINRGTEFVVRLPTAKLPESVAMELPKKEV